MPGGNLGPGMVVDLARAFPGVGAVDPELREVKVGAGAVAEEVDTAARAHGLYFPPLPSSADRCTLGGMIANNAAGARSFRHGSTRDWIRALDVVLADGRFVRLSASSEAPEPFPSLRSALDPLRGAVSSHWPGVRKNSSGYALDRFLQEDDPVQLMVGSEGTLGLITGATLALAPRPPSQALALLSVPSAGDLLRIVETAREVEASACEFLGRRFLELSGLTDDPEYGPLARDAYALVLLELEGEGTAVSRTLDRIQGEEEARGGEPVVARTPEGRRRLWKIRHAASPTIAEATRRGLRSLQFIEDSVVPVSLLPEYLEGLDAILSREGLDAVVFGHAGDGNVHVNPLVDTRTDRWRDQVRRVLNDTAELVASLGGTLAGEHGDGRIRAPLLSRIWASPLVEGFRTVKETLDPGGILNPGVILPLPGQDPLAGISGLSEE